MKQQRKAGRPRKPESEKVARAGKSIHVYLAPSLWDRVEKYTKTLDFPPSTKSLVVKALDDLLKKSGF
jgi:hypothetical protein